MSTFSDPSRSVPLNFGMQGIAAQGDGVEIDDFKVWTDCKDSTQCDGIVTGEFCEFQCRAGYVAVADSGRDEVLRLER